METICLETKKQPKQTCKPPKITGSKGRLKFKMVDGTKKVFFKKNSPRLNEETLNYLLNDYEPIQDTIKAGKTTFLTYHSEFNQIEEFLWIGQNVELGKRLDNDGPLYVGDNTEVGNNCSFVGVNFLSQDIRVGNYVAIQNSAVGPSTTISDRDFVVNQVAFRSNRYFHQTRTSVSSSHPDQDFRKLSAV